MEALFPSKPPEVIKREASFSFLSPAWEGSRSEDPFSFHCLTWDGSKLEAPFSFPSPTREGIQGRGKSSFVGGEIVSARFWLRPEAAL
jgi:hypothetical protein